jgi:hypothetical protein
MRAVVGLVTVLLLLIAIGGIFGSAKIFAYSSDTGSAIHEIEGLIVALIAVVALAGVGILAGLHMVAGDVSAARITQIALARQGSDAATKAPVAAPSHSSTRQI